MTNEKIRQRARIKDVKLWELAHKMGITDSYLSKKLRTEFTPKERRQALKYIDEIAAERGDANDR